MRVFPPPLHYRDIVTTPINILDPTSRLENKRQLRFRTYLALALLDTAAMCTAFILANLIRFGAALASPGINALCVALPVYLCIAADRQIYSSSFFVSCRHNAYTAVKSFVVALVAVLLLSFYLRAEVAMSRTIISLGAVFGAALIVVARLWLHRFSMRAAGSETVSTLVIADGAEIATTDQTLVVDAGLQGLTPNSFDPHMLDRFGALVRRAERVVIACPVDRRLEWAAVLRGANVQGEIVTTELAALGSFRVSVFAEQPTLIVSVGPLDTRNIILKRSFDLAIATLGIVIASPLILVVALAIRLDSPGPVFFRQLRMGRSNRLFSIYKFRSMRDDAADMNGQRSTTRGDPRVTRVGRFIRRTSIDELPQVLNVLRGEMSIVGPRPHALGSLAGEKLFWEVDGRYWNRHAIKPGITGLAQITGFRGETTQASALEGRLNADLAYMRGWTIWRDVRIVAATVFVPFHKNAF